MENSTQDAFRILKEKQLQKLTKQITINPFFKNKSKIKVFPIEASVGKTKTLIDALNELAEWQPQTKTLVVSKFIVEGALIEEKVASAVAVNSDTKVDEETLDQYSVVVITHEMYKILCKNMERRKKYTNGRRNLIIDEELNLTNMGMFDSKEIYTMETILSELSVPKAVDKKETLTNYVDLQDIYKLTIEGIEKKKNNHKNRQMEFFLYEDELAERRIDLLKSLVSEATITEEYLDYLKNIKRIKTDRNSILAKLEMLKKFFNNKKVIVSNKTLYAFDDKIRYFLLDNNIILDASGGFLEVYRLSPIFEIIDCERIVNHSKWTIHISNENSSSYHKHHTPNIYCDLSDMIVKNCTTGDKALVLAKEEDINQIKENHWDKFENLKVEAVEFINFQAMRGKNEWKDFNKCFIIHTPTISFAYYVFNYMLYTGKMPTNEELAVQKIDRNYGFSKNEIFEKIRISDIVSNLYQGIKRINRNLYDSKISDVYILNSNSNVINLLLQQFMKINIDENFKFEKSILTPRKKREQKKYNSEKRKEGSLLEERILKLVSFFNDLESGEYKKRIAREAIGVIDRKVFDRVLKHENIQLFINENKIIWDSKGHNFVVCKS